MRIIDIRIEVPDDQFDEAMTAAVRAADGINEDLYDIGVEEDGEEQRFSVGVSHPPFTEGMSVQGNQGHAKHQGDQMATHPDPAPKEPAADPKPPPPTAPITDIWDWHYQRSLAEGVSAFDAEILADSFVGRYAR
jgi:hypothetical protein